MAVFNTLTCSMNTAKAILRAKKGCSAMAAILINSGDQSLPSLLLVQAVLTRWKTPGCKNCAWSGRIHLFGSRRFVVEPLHQDISAK